jgi:hypothetical protein
MTLLQDIQAAALDSNVDLADTLRKCKVLAFKLKHKEFADWVNHELSGYPDAKSTPKYRQFHLDSLGHFSGPLGQQMQNAPIPSALLPDDLRHFATDVAVVNPVRNIREMIRQSPDGGVQLPWPSDLVAWVQRRVEIYEGMALQQAFRMFTTSHLEGILDTVRTRALDFVLAIEAENPAAGDVGPRSEPAVPAATVTTIYNTTINQGQAIIGNSGTATIDQGDVSFGSAIPFERRAELEELLSRLRDALATVQGDDQAEAADALAKIEAQLANPEPKSTLIASYLSIIASIMTAAAPTVELVRQLLHTMGLL